MSDMFSEWFGDENPVKRSEVVRIVFAHYLYNPGHSSWRPATDVYETDDAVMVRVEIAGTNPNRIVIAASGSVLRIHGERVCPFKKRSFQCLEIPFGEFYTDVILPVSTEDRAISANYHNGFLMVSVAKKDSEKD